MIRSIIILLKRRAFELYHWLPAGEPEPLRAPLYESLTWAPPLPAVANLEAVLRRRMMGRGKRTAVMVARNLGWAFSRFEPDSSLPAS